MKFAPIISGIQKMALYETKAVFLYLLLFGHYGFLKKLYSPFLS